MIIDMEALFAAKDYFTGGSGILTLYYRRAPRAIKIKPERALV
jgi:hypothetical protein